MPAPPPMNTSRRGELLAQREERRTGPCDVELVADREPVAVVQQPGEAAARVELDHELEAGRRSGRWPSRTSGARPRSPGMPMSTYCPALKLERLRRRCTRRTRPRMSCVSSSMASTSVVRRRRSAARRCGSLLVVVQELDLEVGEGVRAAQQRVALVLLEVAAARTSSSGRARRRRRAGTTCRRSTAPPCSRA